MEAGGGLPSRAGFRPEAVPRLLPTLAVVEVLSGGAAFRYRLVGTAITQLAGRNATGRMLDRDLYGPDLERMLVPYRRVVAEAAPVLTRSSILFADSWRSTDNMFVPFTMGTGSVDVIIVSVSISERLLVEDRNVGHIAVIRD